MSTSTMNMSPEDIQKRLHDVLKENVELKGKVIFQRYCKLTLEVAMV